MDLNTINAIISKAFYKPDSEKIAVGKYDDKTVGITVDRFVAYFIPVEDFIFDSAKISHYNEQVDWKRVIPTEDLEDAVRTNELIKRDKNILTVFKCKNVEVFVDEKFLKPFGKNLTYKIKIKNLKYPGVLIYENEILVGYVLPVRYSREKENN